MKRFVRWFMPVLFAACGASSVPMDADLDALVSYEEFRSAIYVEPETGIRILSLDEIVETDGEVFEAYTRYVANSRRAGQTRQSLIVNQVAGGDDKWSATAAQNITYCINQASFGARAGAVVSSMASAAAAWQGVANVRFVYQSALDPGCSKASAVVFNVRQVTGRPYLARAFFPSSSRAAREILIDTSSFGAIAPYTLTGVLRHELGHVLGFRHEHTRPQAGTCFEDSGWRALTNYDSSSVMHYSQCNGSNRGDLVLTSNDSAGSAILYPFANRLAFYRYYNTSNGDHFYTTSWGELGAGGGSWNYEGVAGYISSSQVADTVPLYRYYNTGSGDHFYTTSWGELGAGGGGWNYEGVAGFVPTTAGVDIADFYRYYNTSSGDHFYTTNWGELGAGGGSWNYEGVQCKIFTRPR